MTDTRQPFGSPPTRRSFLERAEFGSAAVLGGTLWATAPAARPRPVTPPIEHVIISCQGDRSFDHYYGYARRSRPGPIALDGRLFAQTRTMSRGSNWPSNVQEFLGGPPRPAVIGITRRKKHRSPRPIPHHVKEASS